MTGRWFRAVSQRRPDVHGPQDGTTTGQLWTSRAVGPGRKPRLPLRWARLLMTPTSEPDCGSCPGWGRRHHRGSRRWLGVPYLVTHYAEESGVSRLLNSWDVWKMAL